MNPAPNQNSFKDTFWSINGSKHLRKIADPRPFTTNKRCIVSVGLHLYQQELKSIEPFRESLKNRGLEVLLLILYPTKDAKTISSQQANDTMHVCLRDLNFWGFPKKELHEKLRHFEADLFINLNANFNYSDMGFALASTAPYRLSSYQIPYKKYFNILLKNHAENDIHAYFDQINNLFTHLT